MERTGRHRACRPAAALLIVLMGTPQAADAAEPPPYPADPVVLARAQAIRALPCTGDAAVDGFTPDPKVPPIWRVAGTLVSVRRAGADRFAFVLAPPGTDGAGCAVLQVLALPRRGTLLQCTLPDHSSQGLGVHTQFPSGRRDVVYWQADGSGRLHRLELDEAGLESDTGALICSLPDAMP